MNEQQQLQALIDQYIVLTGDHAKAGRVLDRCADVASAIELFTHKLKTKDSADSEPTSAQILDAAVAEGLGAAEEGIALLDAGLDPHTGEIKSEEKAVSARLQVARDALNEALVKTSAPKFSGRAVVEVTFNELGTQAFVPSSTGERVYTVSITSEGVAHACTCPHHVHRAAHCKHMKAAEAARWVCERSPDLKTSTTVELIPVRKNKQTRKRGAGSVASVQVA